MPFSFRYPSQHSAPFSIYVAHENTARGGTSWRPQAAVCFTSALHTSGFLRSVGAEEVHSLLVLLSCLAPDGRVLAFTVQLARILNISPRQTRARFRRLAGARWLEQTFVVPVERGGGLDGFALVPGFVPVIEEPQREWESPVKLVPREVLIGHSRRAYARPREEVERHISVLMGWDKSENTAPTEPEITPEERELYGELLAVELLPEQARDLLKRFDALRIRRQLAWLPWRGAKNKAGYLIAAVKDNYAAPQGVGRSLAEASPLDQPKPEQDDGSA